jgi:hypothetical protein
VAEMEKAGGRRGETGDDHRFTDARKWGGKRAGSVYNAGSAAIAKSSDDTSVCP